MGDIRSTLGAEPIERPKSVDCRRSLQGFRMDPTSRWILILVFIALSIWRLARYLRMAIRADATSPGVANNSLVTRLAELLAALVVWLAANAVLWFLLLQLPL